MDPINSNARNNSIYNATIMLVTNFRFKKRNGKIRFRQSTGPKTERTDDVTENEAILIHSGTNVQTPMESPEK
ncbi:unnamed protein product [Cercopithifilaria johnstoni]|uniref:Uncharacterized protein n=1 Tax=Cercopithifilaria johnstoni TaxID=2874296 RepID=A0A8J2MDU0_9BILA|nr:unnamed protein product [Cercopithifilaria johnstoni]